MKRTLLSAVVFTLLFAACKKAETPESYEDKLRGGQWKRSALSITYRGSDGKMTTKDTFTHAPAFIKDNTLEFKVNYVGTEYKNNIKQSAGDADQSEFQWEIYNSGKNIRIYNAGETFTNNFMVAENSINADVLNLTANELSMRYALYVRNPFTQKADTFTFADVFRK